MISQWVLILVMVFSFCKVGHAAEVRFSAQVDRQQIAQDESVSLKFSIGTDGEMPEAEPQFVAPDFEVVNEFNSTFVESYYENGHFGMRNNRQITKVLRPLKIGSLSISGLEMRLSGGRSYTAPSITVQVVAGGGGTPPPRGYGGNGVGLRGAGKKQNSSGFFVRAEVNKEKVYKGEQVIVSYYLYRRVRVFNIQVDKYPELSGFLREDLETPILSPRLDSEPVVLDGSSYQRSLLIRYAAYPLKEGKLTIDPMTIKANYYGTGPGLQEEDPLFNFFQQLSPRISASHSEPLNIEVTPLPTEGRPSSFSGGVGDFNVTSAVDKYEVKANESVMLTVKVEGRGNVSAIEEPKAKWPDQVELYESKGRAKSGRAGVGEKVFEFLLIPRSAGQVTLPKLEFSFFDPAHKSYVTHSTEPIQIRILEPAPGSVMPTRIKPSVDTASAKKKQDMSTPEIRYLKPPGDVGGGSEFQGHPWWRWLYWMSTTSFLIFMGMVLVDLLKKGGVTARALKEAKMRSESKSWQKLRSSAKSAQNGASWQEVTQTYELLSSLILEAIDRIYSIGARSLSRGELERILVHEKGLQEALWKRISLLLESAETVCFASAKEGGSERSARSGLEKWVQEGEAIERELNSKPLTARHLKKL